MSTETAYEKLVNKTTAHEIRRFMERNPAVVPPVLQRDFLKQNAKIVRKKKKRHE